MTCSVRGTGETHIQNFGQKICGERDHFEEPRHTWGNNIKINLKQLHNR